MAGQPFERSGSLMAKVLLPLLFASFFPIHGIRKVAWSPDRAAVAREPPVESEDRSLLLHGMTPESSLDDTAFSCHNGRMFSIRLPGKAPEKESLYYVRLNSSEPGQSGEAYVEIADSHRQFLVLPPAGSEEWQLLYRRTSMFLDDGPWISERLFRLGRQHPCAAIADLSPEEAAIAVRDAAAGRAVERPGVRAGPAGGEAAAAAEDAPSGEAPGADGAADAADEAASASEAAGERPGASEEALTAGAAASALEAAPAQAVTDDEEQRLALAAAAARAARARFARNRHRAQRAEAGEADAPAEAQASAEPDAGGALGGESAAASASAAAEPEAAPAAGEAPEAPPNLADAVAARVARRRLAAKRLFSSWLLAKPSAVRTSAPPWLLDDALIDALVARTNRRVKAARSFFAWNKAWEDAKPKTQDPLGVLAEVMDARLARRAHAVESRHAVLARARTARRAHAAGIWNSWLASSSGEEWRGENALSVLTEVMEARLANHAHAVEARHSWLHGAAGSKEEGRGGKDGHDGQDGQDSRDGLGAQDPAAASRAGGDGLSALAEVLEARIARRANATVAASAWLASRPRLGSAGSVEEALGEREDRLERARAFWLWISNARGVARWRARRMRARWGLTRAETPFLEEPAPGRPRALEEHS